MEVEVEVEVAEKGEGGPLVKVNMEELGDCSICFQQKLLSPLHPCRHTFCLECISSYVSVKCNTFEIPIKCPANKCPSVIDPNDLREILSDDLFKRVIFLTRKKEGFISCPFCSAISAPKDSTNVITCHNCHRTFCSHHGNAHPNHITCEEYEESLDFNPDLKPSMSLIQQTTKECPNCHALTALEEGCNLVKCTLCNTKFCYKCLETNLVVTKSGVQVTCPRCQDIFFDHDHFWKARIFFILTAFLWIPLALAYSATFLACSPLMCVCWSCNFRRVLWRTWIVLCAFPFLFVFGFCMGCPQRLMNESAKEMKDIKEI